MIRYQNDELSERVYRAEMRVRDTYPAGERWFPNVAAIQAYLDECTTLTLPRFSDTIRWRCMAEHYPVDHHGMTASYRSGTIRLPHHPDWFLLAAREIVILHELAHHIARDHKHEPVFIAAFLDLIEARLPIVAEPLRREFTIEGVPYG